MSAPATAGSAPVGTLQLGEATPPTTVERWRA
jgi:hypothetical protein